MKIHYVVLFIAAIAVNIPHANAGQAKVTKVIQAKTTNGGDAYKLSVWREDIDECQGAFDADVAAATDVYKKSAARDPELEKALWFYVNCAIAAHKDQKHRANAWKKLLAVDGPDEKKAKISAVFAEPEEDDYGKPTYTQDDFDAGLSACWDIENHPVYPAETNPWVVGEAAENDDDYRIVRNKCAVELEGPAHKLKLRGVGKDPGGTKGSGLRTWWKGECREDRFEPCGCGGGGGGEQGGLWGQVQAINYAQGKYDQENPFACKSEKD